MAEHEPSHRWYPDVCTNCPHTWPCAAEQARRARITRMHRAYAKRSRR